MFDCTLPGYAVLLLESGCRLSFIGCLQFQVVLGQVDICGFVQTGASVCDRRWLFTFSCQRDHILHFHCKRTGAEQKRASELDHRIARLRLRLTEFCSNNTMDAVVAHFFAFTSGCVLLRSALPKPCAVLRNVFPKLFKLPLARGSNQHLLKDAVGLGKRKPPKPMYPNSVEKILSSIRNFAGLLQWYFPATFTENCHFQKAPNRTL